MHFQILFQCLGILSILNPTLSYTCDVPEEWLEEHGNFKILYCQNYIFHQTVIIFSQEKTFIPHISISCKLLEHVSQLD